MAVYLEDYVWNENLYWEVAICDLHVALLGMNSTCICDYNFLTFVFYFEDYCLASRDHAQSLSRSC